jgi:hypothetical protein
MAHGFAVSFIRLLFKNSEEVKRTRFFSEPGSSGYEIALEVMSAGTLSVSVARQARPNALVVVAPPRRRVPSFFGAQGYRVK